MLGMGKKINGEWVPEWYDWIVPGIVIAVILFVLLRWGNLFDLMTLH